MELEIVESLKKYTRDNFIGGVDNVDKDKKMAVHSQKNQCLRSGIQWVSWAFLIL